MIVQKHMKSTNVRFVVEVKIQGDHVIRPFIAGAHLPLVRRAEAFVELLLVSHHLIVEGAGTAVLFLDVP